MKDLLKSNQQKNQCKTSRAERRKKFNHIKDTLHKNCGNKTFTGISFCPICGKIVKDGKFKNSKWYCKNC